MRPAPSDCPKVDSGEVITVGAILATVVATAMSLCFALGSMILAWVLCASLGIPMELSSFAIFGATAGLLVGLSISLLRLGEARGGKTSDEDALDDLLETWMVFSPIFWLGMVALFATAEVVVFIGRQREAPG